MDRASSKISTPIVAWNDFDKHFAEKTAWMSSRPRRVRETERFDFDLANGV